MKGGIRFAVVFLLKLLPAVSQQNFINVPSSEVTAFKKIFVQQQFNFSNFLQSNTTLDYGLGHGFEAGVNLYNANFTERKNVYLNPAGFSPGRLNPLVMINFLKKCDLTSRTFLCFGSQFGKLYKTSSRNTGAYLTYCNFSINDFIVKNSHIVAGLFYSSTNYNGLRNGAGCWVGADFTVKPKLHVMAESIYSNTNLDYTSLGIVIYPKARIPITLGIQLPNNRANNVMAVIELTLLP